MPALAWGPGIKPGSRNSDIVGGLDYMATFASLAGVKLPENDREGKPIIFDSYDMSPVLFGKGPDPAQELVLFHRERAIPGAVRVGRFKAVFNLRGDDGSDTGGLAVDFEPRLERRHQNTSRPCRRSSTCGRTRRSATTSS